MAGTTKNIPAFYVGRSAILRVATAFIVSIYINRSLQSPQIVVIGEPTINANKSLVVIMGNLRGGEKAWETLYENVLDVNSADLALIIGDSQEWSPNTPYPNSTLLRRAKYNWRFEELDEFDDHLDLVNPKWREVVLPHIKKHGPTGLFGGTKVNREAGGRGSGAIIFMIRWFLAELVKNDPAILETYERFVITRSDHYYQCPHIFQLLDLKNNSVWVPEGEEYFGVTDRHVVVGRENVLDALDILPTMFSHPSVLVGNPNPEVTLKRVWDYKELNVKKFNRTMFTCATKYDTTRWKVATTPAPPGLPQELLLKYPGEYWTTQKRCYGEYWTTQKRC